MVSARLLPQLDDDNRAFWTGGAQRELRILGCRACGAFIHPPRPACRRCRSEDIAPKAVSGRGVVDTFTVNFHPWNSALEVPYVIARVRLRYAPDVILTTNIINCAPEAVDIGDAVQVVFEQHGEIFIPLFERIS